MADDLLHIASWLPWWVGVVLALAGYLGLHRLAGGSVAAAPQSGQAGVMAVQVMIKGGASVLQYILPAILFAGAGVSAWRRRERNVLAADAAKSPAADVLDGMTWQQSEKLVGEAFRLQGYSVT
jgi:restriction system protein